MADVWDEAFEEGDVEPPTDLPATGRVPAPTEPDPWYIANSGATSPIASVARAIRRPPPKGNTPRADLAGARAMNLRDAQGITTITSPDDDWRQDLAEGNKNTARSKLTSMDLTHNAHTGFGLA